MSKPNDTHQKLLDTLNAFEKALETPTVPGEVAAWSETVKRTCQAIDAPLRRQIEDRHRKQYQQIRKEDPELLAKVKKLKEEDQGILEAYDELRFFLERMTERSEQLEPDEMRIEHARQELEEKGLGLVIRVRKQELAVQTWLVEAFDRDRGPVD